ncbi:MAG: gas vesicle protein GvpN, partial [Microcystis sp.]
VEETELSDAQASTPEPSTGNQSLKAIQSLLRGNLPQRKD